MGKVDGDILVVHIGHFHSLYRIYLCRSQLDRCLHRFAFRVIICHDQVKWCLVRCCRSDSPVMNLITRIVVIFNLITAGFCHCDHFLRNRHAAGTVIWEFLFLVVLVLKIIRQFDLLSNLHLDLFACKRCRLCGNRERNRSVIIIIKLTLML